jgi:hypothetical protein
VAACFVVAAASMHADAEECPPVDTVNQSTTWDRSRVWIHEAGWFQALEEPKTVEARGEEYPAEAPMLVITVAGETRAYPVHAMAYHHVANDTIGGEPVVTTY